MRSSSKTVCVSVFRRRTRLRACAGRHRTGLRRTLGTGIVGIGLLVAIGAAGVLAGPGLASAQSDFWDEVRTPGLQAFRHHVARARAAIRARRFAHALDAAELAVETLPARAEGHVLRGRALGELERAPEALEAFYRALELDPAALDESADGRPAATIAATAGDHALSARILHRVLGRMPDSATRHYLYTLYGDVLLALGPAHLHEAIRAYREAIRGTATLDGRAGLGLALALLRAGELAEARSLVETVAHRSDPEDLAELPEEGAATSPLGALIERLPVPPTERAARSAIALEALDDPAAARVVWRVVAAEDGPWQSDAAHRARGETPRQPDAPAMGSATGAQEAAP